MPSRLNKLVVDELSAKFRGVDTCFFVDFTGLSGRKAADLRYQIRSACGGDTALTVVKTSLAKRALAQAADGQDLADGPVGEYLEGPTAIAYGADDPVLLARTLADWARKEASIRFKGGLLVGRPLAPDAVAELAKIPPKPILMGHVVGMIAAPLTSLLNVGNGLIRKLLALCDALAKKNSEADSE